MILPENQRGKNALEINLEKEVIINCQSGTFLGVLSAIGTGTREIYLLPSIVYEPDGKTMRLETEFPTVISASHFEGDRLYSIRPFRDGYLAEAVALSQRASCIVGFGSVVQKDNPSP